MKRLTFVALGLALCAAVTVCLAQQPPSAPKSSPAASNSSFDPFGAPPVADEAPIPDVADAESLRAQLLELLKQKADILDGEQLKSALTEAQQELHELHGARRLEEARQLLEQITLEHPNTNAAQKAELILRDWNSNARYAFPRSSAAPADHNANPI
jgi:hypothetical protein